MRVQQLASMADSPDAFADNPWRTRSRDRVQALDHRAIVRPVLAKATLLSRLDSRSTCRRSCAPHIFKEPRYLAVDLAGEQSLDKARQFVSQLEIKIALGIAHRMLLNAANGGIH